MKLSRLAAWSISLGLGAGLMFGQDTNPTEVEQLREQLQEALGRLEKSSQQHEQTIRRLQERLEKIQSRPEATGTDLSQIPPPLPGAAPQAWRISDPIRFRRGSAYLDLGLVGTFAAGSSTAEEIEGGLQLGGHDPNQRGFTVQGVEATFSGAVDPYFRGLATVTFHLDAEGDTGTELEEAYLESMALPANLQLRAGQFFTEFGRHNSWHLHSWHFVDLPLVNARLLGPDGLRNPGARLSWLMPAPFYSELFVNVQNSQGTTAASFRSTDGRHHGDDPEDRLSFAYRKAENNRGIRHADDLLLGPRYAASVDLADDQLLLLGVSALFGPNASGGNGAGSTRTEIYGVDLTWKWKSPTHAGGFPFVTWQSEVLWRRYEAGRFSWDLDGNGALDSGEVGDPGTGLPAVLGEETLDDYGCYTQWLWGFRKGWVSGLRLDYVTGAEGEYENRRVTLDGESLGRDLQRASRWRLSPNLTWYPTEFSKFRLQYNYDHRKGIGQDHSVWLQFEFALGAHAAHQF